MQNIKFSTFDQTVEIPGYQYDAWHHLCADMLGLQFRLATRPGDWRDAVLPKKPFVRFNKPVCIRDPKEEAFECAHDLREEMFLLNGEEISKVALQHNSALQWGNPPVQIAARFHALGWKHPHPYCEPEDRAWLADLIEQALDARTLDPAFGWNEVVALLRSASEGPVVMTYQIFLHRRFPDTDTLVFERAGIPLTADIPWETVYQPAIDAWEALSREERWEYGMTYIRQTPEIRISPETLAMRVDHGMSGVEFVEKVRALAGMSNLNRA